MQTEDVLTRDMLAATSAFINATQGNNGDNPTQLTSVDIANTVAVLLSNDAMTIDAGIEGDDKFGTGPIRRAFFGMTHTDLTSTFEGVAGFFQVNQYPSPNRALPSEWGAVGSVRFLVSSIGSITPNASAMGANVYNTFITGLEGYAKIEQDGYSASFIYRPPIFDGPLALNASVGYKMAEVPRILNDLWVINLRSTFA